VYYVALLSPSVSGQQFHPRSGSEQRLSDISYSLLPGHMQVCVVIDRCREMFMIGALLTYMFKDFAHHVILF